MSDPLLLVVGLLSGLLLREFLPGYLREKGKNLATKEDLRELTEIVESFKPGTAQAVLRQETHFNSKLNAYSRALDVIYRKFASDEWTLTLASGATPASAQLALQDVTKNSPHVSGPVSAPPDEAEVNLAYGTMCLFCEDPKILEQYNKIMGSRSSAADVGDLLDLMRQDLGYGHSILESMRMPYIFGRERTNALLARQSQESADV